ncbi:class I SAM-dependent methyltransferase [Methanolobus halotolerans]|uniref:Class I SAM-dependent methyltransferase n=1 Tax=Methanolobus halotolerans TaxID=2052935 RepID=A0A4E0PUQ2_9EURY|nr:class I SAM-dependent methyltransferase [Methanolobus halotolerans]TGC08943.1 class I SAM-dependent methyltransferase [Methanolobus halotolerans]
MNDLSLSQRAWEEEYRHVTWGGSRSISAVEDLLAPGSFVLDAGCGNGRYLLPLSKKYHVVGSDISLVALSRARNYLEKSGQHAVYAAASITHLPFSNDSFDAVVCYGVLQHLFASERSLAVEELIRVLRPNGLLFFEVFGTNDMRFGGDEVENNTFRRKGGIIYHYFTEKELELLFRGFDIGEIRSIMTEKIFRGERYTRHHIKGIARSLKSDI